MVLILWLSIALSPLLGGAVLVKHLVRSDGDGSDSQFEAQESSVLRSQTNETLPKRAYSVLDPEEVHDAGLSDFEELGATTWPTPEGESGPRIRYCFKERAVQERMLTAFAMALAMWSPMEDFTPLRIEIDPACRNGNSVKSLECICGVQLNGLSTAKDTLVVSDGLGEVGEDDGPVPKGAKTNLGYNAALKSVKGRHELNYGVMLRNEQYAINPVDAGGQWVTGLTHELGKCNYLHADAI